MPVDLDALDIRELVRLAKGLLRTLKRYQRHAAATRFPVSIPVILAWQLFSRAAVSAEAELSRLGLPFRCPPTEGSHSRLMAVEGLREWLLRMRGSDEQGWAARELGPPIHQGELPDLAIPLAELREVVRDLSAAAGQGSTLATTATDPARQPNTPPADSTVPLPKNPTARAALAIIRAEKGRGLVAKEIVTRLAKNGIHITDGHFRRHIVPELKAHGIKNAPARGGYYDATCVESM
jgi:hypothetical protein